MSLSKHHLLTDCKEQVIIAIFKMKMLENTRIPSSGSPGGPRQERAVLIGNYPHTEPHTQTII